MYFVIGFAVFILFTISGLVYLYKRIRKYSFIKEHRVAGRVIAALAPLAASVLTVLLLSISFVNVIIILMHLIVFWMLCDLTGYIVKKAGKNKKKKKKARAYYAGGVAIALTVVYLGIGWFLGYNVFETTYSLVTEKYIDEGLRIAQITDSHLGVTLDGERFADKLTQIQESEPDLLVITGDFVDDDSTRDDMERACEAIGDFEAKYGKFFVHGNHDKGYFEGRDFSCEELESKLKENGVRILKDESVFIDSSFYVVGRRDASDPERKDISELTCDLDHSKYIIVLDHQPNDYDNEASAEVDLVLSGHSHGGQMFPIGIVGELSGAYDNGYGYEKRDNTDFITSSGISAWAIPFKTFTFSEYTLIDISQK